MHGFASKFATLTAGKGARRARLLSADKAGTDTSIVNLVTGMPTEGPGSNDLPDGPEHEDYNLVLRRLLGLMRGGQPTRAAQRGGVSSGLNPIGFATF